MSTTTGPPTGPGSTVIDDQHGSYGLLLLDVQSLVELRSLPPMSDWSRVRTLDITIHSADDALALRLALSDLHMGSLERLHIVSHCSTVESHFILPLRAHKLQKASFAAIFIDLDAPSLNELDITYDSSEPLRPSAEGLLATLERSSRLRRLDLTDCLPAVSEQTEHSLSLHHLEYISLTESASSPHLRCSSFLRFLSFPSSTEQHLSTVDIEDALDLLCASAPRIWAANMPTGVQLDVKSGFIGFNFYSNVHSHREKDDVPLNNAKMRAEISIGVKARHLPPLMYALASSVDLTTVTTLSLHDDTSPQPDDDGAHWRSVFASFSSVCVLHLADTRGAPQPLLLLALGALSETTAYADSRRSTSPQDDGESSPSEEDGVSVSSRSTSASSDGSISGRDDIGGEVGSGGYESDDSRSTTDSNGPETSSIERPPTILGTQTYHPADEEIAPFPMLAQRLRQLQQTIFIELNPPNATSGDLLGPQAPSEEGIEGSYEGPQEAEAPANPENSASETSGSRDGPCPTEDEAVAPDVDGDDAMSGEELVLPGLDILWLASRAEHPVNVYTFPLEALVRALTSRAKSHRKAPASRSPRTLRIDVAVALREPGVTEPHLLEARVRFPNILWTDG
ncbi:hypothetical protein PENSPDRAFT_732253 [Peniophora sp. CONT]|nr:hypothetical protein PENSPDRAFT_732253 [Peniophora sp. CONT]